MRKRLKDTLRETKKARTKKLGSTKYDFKIK